MTVQELIDRLRDFPPEMEVNAVWDTVPSFTVHRVERFKGKWKDATEVALIDCGDSQDGDWEYVCEENALVKS